LWGAGEGRHLPLFNRKRDCKKRRSCSRRKREIFDLLKGGKYQEGQARISEKKFPASSLYRKRRAPAQGKRVLDRSCKERRVWKRHGATFEGRRPRGKKKATEKGLERGKGKKGARALIFLGRKRKNNNRGGTIDWGKRQFTTLRGRRRLEKKENFSSSEVKEIGFFYL